MINRKIEDEIYEAAIKALEKNINIPIKIEREIFGATNNNLQDDKRILQLEIKNNRLLFHCEIIPTLTQAVLNLLLLQKQGMTYQQLIVTRYIAPQMAKHLMENNFQFIDTAGNVFINQLQFYIYITGNKIPDIFKQVPNKRIFKPTGLKMVFALLCNPYLMNRPYREIALNTGVALGTVSWIVYDLKELRYLIDTGKKEKKLINKLELFNRWCVEYPEKLRPKLFFGRFRGDTDLLQNQTLNPENAQWGGEIAAAKLAGYLKPQVFTVYTTKDYLEKLIIENKLLRDNNGNIELLNRFWTFKHHLGNNGIVHPMLVYADLIATKNQRNIEAAKMIYEQYITQYILED